MDIVQPIAHLVVGDLDPSPEHHSSGAGRCDGRVECEAWPVYAAKSTIVVRRPSSLGRRCQSGYRAAGGARIDAAASPWPCASMDTSRARGCAARHLNSTTSPTRTRPS